MLQLFVNGPPGAGKTSLCKLLCDEFGLELVATGDLLRENILQRTPLGVVAKDCISRRSLVPDHIVVDMVAEKICDCAARKSGGWVLDGFPRTPEQSAALRRKHIFPSVVIVLELSEHECARRITGRRFDPTTSRIYHMPSIMPRDAAVLARLTKRSDDAPDKLPPRFEAYRQHGEATNALYDGIVHRVDVARRPLDEIVETVVRLLHSAARPQHAGATIRGNQAIPSAALPTSGGPPPPVIPIVKRGVAPHHHRDIPQRIDEEDEEQVAQEAAHGEIHYDDESAVVTPSVVAVPERRPSGAAAPLAGTPTSAATLPAELPRIEVNFRAMHADLTRQMGATTLPTSAPASPSSSPASSPSQSPSSARAKATQDTESFAFQAASNNEDAGSAAASPAQSPPASPVGSYAASAAAARSAAASGFDMAKFRDLLLDGFDVFKHGRRGSPHARTIFADMEFKRIFWMKPGKEAKAKKAKLDQSLLLADVVQVVRGMKTEVLKRSGDVAKYERYLSLVADDRTLDLELPSEAMCEFLLRGFELLLHGSS